MQLNQKMIMFISLVIGAISFFLINQALQKKAQPVVEKTYVVAAAKDLQVGVTLNKNHLRKIIAPDDSDPAISFTDKTALIGQIVRNPIRRGDVVTDFDVVSESDNMAGLIPEGYRATTIPIVLSDETVSFLKFGNRVDLLFTDVVLDKSKNRNVARTKTIIKNALVMKVSKVDREENGRKSNRAYVTIAVRPEWAETLAYAMQKGKIDMLVRPIVEGDIREDYISFDQLLGNETNNLVKDNVEIEIIRKTKKQVVRIAK